MAEASIQPARGDQSQSIGPEVYGRVLEVAGRLAATSDLAEVLRLIIDALRDMLGADRASVFQYDRAAHEFFATSAHGLPGDLRLPAEAGIIGEAGRTLKQINITDAYADARFNRSVDAMTGYRTRCILTIPLIDFEGQLVGVAQVLNKGGSGVGGDSAAAGLANGVAPAVFDARDERIAGYLSTQAGVAIKRAALIESEREKERLAASLDLARKIQQAALPAVLPRVLGYEIVAKTRPADETGGDTYDVIGTPCGGAVVFLADATGHGIGPALSAAHALAMVRMGVALGAPLEQAVRAMNAQLALDLPLGRFVTALLGRLDPMSHTLSAVAAGQAPTMVVRADGRTELLDASCAPLGIDPEMPIHPLDPIVLAPGDVVALLSDGYYEAMSDRRMPIGSDAVTAVVREHRSGTAGEILAAVDAAIAAYAPGAADDDRTAIIIRRAGA